MQPIDFAGDYVGIGRGAEEPVAEGRFGSMETPDNGSGAWLDDQGPAPADGPHAEAEQAQPDTGGGDAGPSPGRPQQPRGGRSDRPGDEVGGHGRGVEAAACLVGDGEQSACLRMLRDWIATSRTTMATTSSSTDRCANPAITNATSARIQPSPVAGIDQPRSCSRPLRCAATAPASPNRPNRPIPCPKAPGPGWRRCPPRRPGPGPLPATAAASARSPHYQG